MTGEAKKIAKLRLLKRIGLIGLFTSGAIGLVFLILSLLPQGQAAFSIRIDNPASKENAKFSIFTTAEKAQQGSKKNSVSYLAGEPLKRAGQTDAKVVEQELSKIENFEGSGKIVNERGDHELALVYSVYLTNNTEEEISVKYAVRLDAFKETAVNNISAPIEYFRVLVQTQEVGNDASLSNKYYGQRSNGRHPDYVYASEDGREPIYTVADVDETSVQTVIKTDYQSPGNDGYCINFSDYRLTKDIVISEVNVPVGKVLRYTFVAFFDGQDVDGWNILPNDDYLLISLHFGV